MIWSIPALLGGLIAVLPVASGAVSASPAAEIVTGFRDLCATGEPSPRAMLAKADAQGWQRDGPDMPRNFDPRTDRVHRVGQGVLILHVAASTTAGERQDTCGVSMRKPVEGLVQATANWLGFAPSAPLGTSATFFATRTQDGWRSGAALDREAFKAEKARGRFYSIMVLGGDDAASLLWLRAYPAAAETGRP